MRAHTRSCRPASAAARRSVLIRSIQAAAQDVRLHLPREFGVSGFSEPYFRKQLGLLRECGKPAIRKQPAALFPIKGDPVVQDPDIEKRADPAAAVFKVLCHMGDVVKVEHLIGHIKAVRTPFAP